MAASVNLASTSTSHSMDEEQSLRECEAYVQKHDIQKILKVLHDTFSLISMAKNSRFMCDMCFIKCVYVLCLSFSLRADISSISDWLLVAHT